MNHKHCRRCGETKPATEFARHAERQLQDWCRACCSKARREYRQQVRDQQPERYELVKLADRLRKRRERLQRILTE